MTSKRQVTRNRRVVEVQKMEPRDPRFLPLSGKLSEDQFKRDYKFLADNRVTELAALRENLKRVRKLLSSTPRDQREEREAEISRLELAVKRGESSVNRDKRERVERIALEKVANEEKEKRKGGKGGWWLKKSEQKEVVVRARYEALAAEGGQRAVKKTIEKKQKKMGQKEKRSRPFQSRDGYDGQEGANSRKRRKLS